MRRRIRIAKIAFACFLMHAVIAHAVPLSFQFTATGQSVSYGYPTGSNPLEVPAPFSEFIWPFEAPVPVFGTFTIESDTRGRPTFTNVNGVLFEIGSSYTNPVTQLNLNIRDQQFAFSSTLPPGSCCTLESDVNIRDLPLQNSIPTTGPDSMNFTVLLGTGIFDGPYSHLEVRFSMRRFEQDLSVISSRDMVENLVYATSWTSFFTIYDPVLRSSYQLHAPVTSLAQVEVPEPGTLGLFAIAFALPLLAARTRKRV